MHILELSPLHSFQQHTRTCMGHGAHMEIKFQPTQHRSCKRDGAFSQSCGRERTRREGGEGGETRPHSFQRKEVFGGPGSKVFSVTVFQSMRNLLLTCLSHHTLPALTALLS